MNLRFISLPQKFMITLWISMSILCFNVSNSFASSGKWNSKTLGAVIDYTATESPTPLKDNAGNFMTVVYLENLGFAKIGSNSNESNVQWLLSQGYRVVELNYTHSNLAVSPAINNDIIEINKALSAGSFCGLTNCSKYRSYVLFEGYRIARDVPYFKDDPSVYNYPASYTEGDSLRMDIVYPANASVKVPVVISFSYSNSYAGNANQNQRLNLGNTLAGFNDSFLEGAPANGIAWAIADHPKYCPWGNGKPANGANDTYKSYQTNPDAAQKVKSAIRTLRKVGEDLGLSGKIGVYGFSRGSDAGSMAVGDRVVPEFENAGFNQDLSDAVQAAALGSGVFDFTYIYHTTGDGDTNLETRCPWAWGTLDANFDKWQKMGSYYLAETNATAPVLFFYNTSDANYYQEQIGRFKAKLDSLGVSTSTITNYGTGHSVPQTSSALNSLYNFFKQFLNPPSLTSIHELNQKIGSLSMTIAPNPANEVVSLSFYLNNACNVQIALIYQNGTILYQTEKYFSRSGIHSDTIRLKELNLNRGLYQLMIKADGMQEIRKLFIE